MAAYKKFVCLFVTKNMEMFTGIISYIRSLIKLIIKLAHDKTNKMECAPSEESDHPGHPLVYQSSLCAQWVAKDPSFRQADCEDSDQTGRMLGIKMYLLIFF